MVEMFRVKTEMTGLAGAPYLNQMYFLASGGSAQGAVNAVGAFWGAVDSQMVPDLIWNTLADVDVVEHTTGQIVSVAQTTPTSGQGTAGGEVLPFATQGLVRWRTAVYINGRELRGKTFVPGLSEAASIVGQMAGATQTAIDNAAQALIADPASDFTIYSRKWHVNASAAAGSTWNQFAVLRSRRD